MKIYFNSPLKDGLYVGLDLASKSGWAVTLVKKGKAELIDYGSVALPAKVDEITKLTYMENTLLSLIDKHVKSHANPQIVIEDCFLGCWNPKTFKVLARLEGYMTHAILHRYTHIGIKNVHIVYPSHSRKLVGIPGNASKVELVKAVNELLHQPDLFKEEHNNITDAIILSLCEAVQSV